MIYYHFNHLLIYYVTIAKTTGAFSRKISPLSLLIPSKLKVLLSLGFKGYLAEKGWFSAFQTKSSIDENGNPIPWVTYSFIDFISDRINDTHAVKALSEDGVIVLDDAERPQYAEALRFLANNGFRNIPFSGIAPGVIVSKVTTIFYKEKNCLGI